MFMTGVLCTVCSAQVYLKVGQTSRSRSRGQNLWYPVKGLVTRNKHVKYESFILNGLKVMAKVKVFVYVANADADTDGDGRAIIISSPDIHPGSLKITRRIRYLVSIGERI